MFILKCSIKMFWLSSDITKFFAEHCPISGANIQASIVVKKHISLNFVERYVRVK